MAESVSWIHLLKNSLQTSMTALGTVLPIAGTVVIEKLRPDWVVHWRQFSPDYPHLCLVMGVYLWFQIYD